MFYTTHSLQWYNSCVGPRVHLELLQAADSLPATDIKPPSLYFLMYQLTLESLDSTLLLK
jgi:hypothetical protein